MIRTLFVSMGELNKGARRPAAVPKSAIQRVGIVGAGFMGAGIAYATALAGLDVVLLDQTQEAADKGKARSHKLVSDQIAKGRAKTADRDALLARITATTEDAALRGCDLVIEAVFEDPAVKKEHLPPRPGRAEAGRHPRHQHLDAARSRPWPKVRREPAKSSASISSRRSSACRSSRSSRAGRPREPAIALAFDYVRLLKKTPILVNDARGFYANRCVGAYLFEGHKMVAEGVPPAMVENAGRQAGMPVGPLSLSDEVALDLVPHRGVDRRRGRGGARCRAARPARRARGRARPPRPQEPQGLLRLPGAGTEAALARPGRPAAEASSTPTRSTSKTSSTGFSCRRPWRRPGQWTRAS